MVHVRTCERRLSPVPLDCTDWPSIRWFPELFPVLMPSSALFPVGRYQCMWWWYCCYWNQKPWRDPEIPESFAVSTGYLLSAPWGLSRKRRPHAATAPVTIQEGHYPFWWQWWWRLSLTCTVEELCVCVWIATHANEICSWKWWSHDVKLTATGAANSVE